MVKLLSALLAIQTLAFDAASIKPTPPDVQGTTMRGDRGRIVYNGATLRNCIINAYELRDYQLSGPEWINSARFDIVATLPPNADRSQAPQMLQTLLKERFKLEVHRETREFSVYALTVGKNGPKFRESASTEDGSSTKSGRGHMEAQRIKMSGLAASLSYWAGRPVVDMTGLNGRYDLTLDFVPDPALSMKGTFAEKEAERTDRPEGPSIFTAVMEQLGLRLEPRKAPIEVLVVDRMERTPTEN